MWGGSYFRRLRAGFAFERADGSIFRMSETPLLSTLARTRDQLPEGLQRIASLIMDNPAAAAAMTIGELASRTDTSPATVNRFAHAVGCAGYPELRVAIATESGRSTQASWAKDIGGELKPDDSLERVAYTIAAADTRAIEETLQRLDLPALAAITAAIVAARRVDLFGIGGSSMSADELRFRLQRIGVRAWVWQEAHAGLTAAALHGPDDVLIVASYSGRTQEAIDVISEAQRHGSTTVVITNFADSPLARLADLVLTTAVHETTFRSEALAAQHSQLFLIDLIFVTVAQQTYERSSAAFERTAQAVAGRLVPPTGRGGRAGQRKSRPRQATTPSEEPGD